MEALKQNLKVEDLALESQNLRSFTYSIAEIDKINELLFDAESILGIITSLNLDDIDSYENGYITRLALKGLDAVKEALSIINKE